MADAKQIFLSDCEGFRKTCAENQTIIRGLMEQAIKHSEDLCVTKSEQLEKHQEVLISMITGRVEVTERNINDLHKKINNIFITILIGAILGLMALVGGADYTYSRIATNTTNDSNMLERFTKHLSDSNNRDRKIENINSIIARCKENLAQSIVTLDHIEGERSKYDNTFKDIEKRLDRLEQSHGVRN